MDDMQHVRELNLRTHRDAASVWDRRDWNGGGTRIGITRVLVGAAGAAMAIQGLRHQSRSGRVIAGLGTALAWWALTSASGEMPQIGRWCAQLVGGGRADVDPELDASADSFPASDPPASTAAVGTGLRRAPAGR
jgi:hypothetical protein